MARRGAARPFRDVLDARTVDVVHGNIDPNDRFTARQSPQTNAAEDAMLPS
jgi:hypothetical protein